VLLKSAVLERLSNVVHGFSTRLGGVSTGPWAGLNVGEHVGDDPGAVAENRRRLAAALGHPRALVEVEQVHGAAVVHADDAATTRATRADALVSVAPGVAVGVRTADCAPVLVAARDGDDPGARAHAVAAIHAGWRGACDGIVPAAIDALVVRGARRDRLVAAIGPTIALEDFEVGDEVVEAARRALGGREPKLLRGPNDRWHLDLVALVTEQLRAAGVETIDHVGAGTVRDRGLTYSHRRDQGRTGRHLSVIARL
jgi:YfiH family protein